MAKINCGIQLYTLRKFLGTESDVIATFKRLSKMGVRTVQISGMKYPMPAKDIKKLCDDTGISVVVTHNSFDRFLNDLDKLSEEHSIFGCSSVGLGSMPGEYRKDGFARFNEFTDKVNDIAEKLAKNGQKFAYHNHAFELQNKIGGMRVYDKMIEQFDKRVEFIMDTYWIRYGGGSNEEYIRKLTGRIKNIHLKDYQGKMQVVKNETLNGIINKVLTSKLVHVLPRYTELGNGELPFKKLCDLAVSCGTENALYEQDVCKDPWQSTEVSWAYMQKNLMK